MAEFDLMDLDSLCNPDSGRLIDRHLSIFLHEWRRFRSMNGSFKKVNADVSNSHDVIQSLHPPSRSDS